MKKTYVLKSITLAMTFACLFFLQSCSKLLALLNYNVTLNTGTVTFAIPPAPAGSSVDTLENLTTTYNIDSFVKATTSSTLGTANITSVKLSSCVLNITSGANANNSFANFGSCTVLFSSNYETSPYQISIPSMPTTYASSLSMPVDTATELKSYINGNTFNYSVSGTVRKATTDTLHCTMTCTFHVGVQG